MKKYSSLSRKVAFLFMAIATLAISACSKGGSGGGGDPQPQKTTIQLLTGGKWTLKSADITLASNGATEHITSYLDYSIFSDVTFSPQMSFVASGGNVTGGFTFSDPFIEFSAGTDPATLSIIAISDKALSVGYGQSDATEKFPDNTGAIVVCSRIVLNFTH